MLAQNHDSEIDRGRNEIAVGILDEGRIFHLKVVRRWRTDRFQYQSNCTCSEPLQCPHAATALMLVDQHCPDFTQDVETPATEGSPSIVISITIKRDAENDDSLRIRPRKLTASGLVDIAVHDIPPRLLYMFPPAYSKNYPVHDLSWDENDVTLLAWLIHTRAYPLYFQKQLLRIEPITLAPLGSRREGLIANFYLRNRMRYYILDGCAHYYFAWSENKIGPLIRPGSDAFWRELLSDEVTPKRFPNFLKEVEEKYPKEWVDFVFAEKPYSYSSFSGARR